MNEKILLTSNYLNTRSKQFSITTNIKHYYYFDIISL